MPRLGFKREDGRTWLDGRWMTEKQIEDRKAKRKLRDQARSRRKYLKRVSTPEGREAVRNEGRRSYAKHKGKLNEKRVERRRQNLEHEQKVWREWYAANQEREFTKITERRKRNNPAYGLFSTISEYRRGRIGFDEVVRRCEDAFARTDELCSKISSEKREPVGDVERSGQCGEGGSGTGESQG